MNLAELQALFYRLITAPNGVAEALATERNLPVRGLDAIIISDEQLCASDRLDIYANAYFYRLLEVLKEDYPATLAVISDSNFHNLVTGYLIDNPPTQPSIYYAGRKLPDYLRMHRLHNRWPFIADLALLERTLLEMFHGPNADPLQPSEMTAIPPDQWGEVKMRTHPASRSLDLEWHVEDVRRTVEAGDRWAPPSRGPLKLLVWRNDTAVLCRELEAGEIGALTLARDGATFASICEMIAIESNDPEPAALISRLLARWLSAGVLVREL